MAEHRFPRGQPLPPRFVRDLLSDDTTAEIAERWALKPSNVGYHRSKVRSRLAASVAQQVSERLTSEVPHA